MPKFQPYQRVRVIQVLPRMDSNIGDCFPQVGDIGTVVEVYSDPEAYCVEAVLPNGRTKWLMDFSPDDLQPETIRIY